MMENKNRYYVNNGSIVPLEDLQPAEYIIGSADDLTVLVGNAFPGSIARIAGTKTRYEMKPNGEWSEAHNEENDDFAPDISNPQDGDTLVYDGTAGKWVNGAASGGGGGFVMTGTVDLSTMIATANKTAQEIYDAFMAGRQVVGVIELMGETQAFSLVNLFYNNSGVWFYFDDAGESKTYEYSANNMTDYPTCDLGGSNPK